MRCPNCDFDNFASSAFCSKCGKPQQFARNNHHEKEKPAVSPLAQPEAIPEPTEIPQPKALSPQAEIKKPAATSAGTKDLSLIHI